MTAAINLTVFFSLPEVFSAGNGSWGAIHYCHRLLMQHKLSSQSICTRGLCLLLLCRPSTDPRECAYRSEHGLRFSETGSQTCPHIFTLSSTPESHLCSQKKTLNADQNYLPWLFLTFFTWTLIVNPVSYKKAHLQLMMNINILFKTYNAYQHINLSLEYSVHHRCNLTKPTSTTTQF